MTDNLSKAMADAVDQALNSANAEELSTAQVKVKILNDNLAGVSAEIAALDLQLVQRKCERKTLIARRAAWLAFIKELEASK